MIRYNKTLKFLNKYISKDKDILDLGVENNLSVLMRKEGYPVFNTAGENLDIDFGIVTFFHVITAFEIFEHMFAPYHLLHKASGRLVASVPLKVWFASAYWNKEDDLACHYHEFEIKQFNRLLEKTGWTIKHFEVWRSPDKIRFGIRPFLRFLYPSYYIVLAEKL